MRLKIAILAGDGIGPEVTHEAVNILVYLFVALLVVIPEGNLLPP